MLTDIFLPWRRGRVDDDSGNDGDSGSQCKKLKKKEMCWSSTG